MNFTVIGIGIIGKEIVSCLTDSGHNVSIYNWTADKMAGFESKGVNGCHNSSDAVNGSDIIILTLADWQAINDMMFASNIDFSNKMIIQMGTISPEESMQAEKKVAAAGGRYVESPILGSRREIQQKSIILLGRVVN